MRLGRENTLITLGIALSVLPLLGLPSELKIRAASGIGIVIALISLSVRRRVVVLKRKLIARDGGSGHDHA